MPSPLTRFPRLVRYLKFQVMIFAFGIIGPIFLIIYFVSQPDPTLKWMYFTGLIVTAIDILIALLLTADSTDERDVRH